MKLLPFLFSILSLVLLVSNYTTTDYNKFDNLYSTDNNVSGSLEVPENDWGPDRDKLGAEKSGPNLFQLLTLFLLLLLGSLTSYLGSHNTIKKKKRPPRPRFR